MGADFGLPGVEFTRSAHVCALYFGEAERDDILLPFLRSGLRAGDKCVCIQAEAHNDTVLGQLGEAKQVDAYVSSGQLDLMPPGATYLRTRRFSKVDMLGFWTDALASATEAGFTFARAAGETDWAVSGTDLAEFIGYESELNRLVSAHDVAIVCLYDMALWGGRVVVDLLKTHPQLLMGGMLLENPHWLTPEEFRATQ